MADDDPYTDFADLPDGSDRPVTMDNILLAISAKEWADRVVSEMFLDYCEVFEIHRAYGVESWSIAGCNISITQDISARSCYNTKEHLIPLAYLPTHGRLPLMRDDRAKALEAKNLETKRQKQQQIADLERQLKVLRGES